MRTKRDISQSDRLYASLNRLIFHTVLLSAEEEYSLACDGSPKARDRLILSYLPLVKSIAFRFKDYDIDVKDCFNQGVVGLIKAIDRYDPTRGRLAACLTSTKDTLSYTYNTAISKPLTLWCENTMIGNRMTQILDILCFVCKSWDINVEGTSCYVIFSQSE